MSAAQQADLSVEWYYVTSAGEQAGPVNLDELRSLYAQKHTNDSCLCWNEHMPGWTLIAEVALLQQHVTPAKPLPPPLPSTQLPLSPLNTTAEVSPAPPASASSPSSSTSTPTNGGSLAHNNGLKAVKLNIGAMAAQAASKQRAMKKDRASLGSLAAVTKPLNGAAAPTSAPRRATATGKLSRADSSNSNGSPASSSSPAHAVSPRHASTSSFSGAARSPSSSTAHASHAPPGHSPSPSLSTPAAFVPPATPTVPYTPDEIAAHLTAAITALDPDALSHWLAAGDAIQLDEQRYCVSPLARMYLSKLDTARRRMRDAVASMDESELCEAVWYAEAIGYERLDVASCRKLRDAVIQLNLEARQQLIVLDDKKMKLVLTKADQLSLHSAPVEQLRQLVQHTSEEKLRQLQLKAANALQDKHRATRLTIALKQLVFKRTGHLFTLDSYGRWRDADDWAAEKMLVLNKAEVKEGMRKWSKEVIHAPLSRLASGEQRKLALKVFKRILSYCGERGAELVGQYEHVREVLEAGLGCRELRDEVYLQLMKQLTHNPSSDSERQAWRLMYACLDTFPPAAELENILELWLSKHIIQGTAAVAFLHQTLYDGERRTVPTEAELSSICQGKALRVCQYEQEVEYNTPRALLPERAEVQRLAGTTAAGIKAFIASGQQPDWSEIDIRMPERDGFKQPEPKCEVKLRRADSGSGVGKDKPAPVVVGAAPSGGTRSGGQTPRLVVDTALPVVGGGAVGVVSPSNALMSLSLSSPTLARDLSASAVLTAAAPSTPSSTSAPPPLLSASLTLSSPRSQQLSSPPSAAESAPSSTVPPPPPPVRVRVWGKAFDPSTGQPYFYHLETKQTTWEQPADYFD